MIPTRRILDPIFGAPVLRYGGSGMAGWCRENSLSQWQKGSGWTANLYGGAQSGDDWAAIFVPANEVRIPDFNSALWTYLMTNTETMGVNLVIWVHDPNDNNKRAEITQLANVAGLGKTAGWNAHTLDKTVAQFFYFGEDWSTGSAVALTGSGLTAGPGNLYTWAQFQADVLFKTWTIYRISLEYGWEASGTYEDAWVADLKLNGQRILLKPQLGDHVGGEVKTLTQKTTGTSTTKATMITPATAKRVRIISVSVVNLSNTGSEIQAYFHTGADIDGDVAKAIFSAWCDTDFCSSASQSWPDGAGPVGAIGEVVSICTSVDISTNGRVTIVYREE